MGNIKRLLVVLLVCMISIGCVACSGTTSEDSKVNLEDMTGSEKVDYFITKGKNDYEAVRRAGAGGHKEINRTNLSMEDIEEALKKDVVMTQLKLLRFRKNFPAFEKMNNIKIQAVGSTICFTWENEGYIARLNADFRTCEFKVEGIDPQGDTVFNLEN